MTYSMLEALNQEVELAKDTILSGNYVAARQKLIEVQHLAPTFDDISGMITVCDILHSAAYEILGAGTDYYWILEVSPAASHIVIRMQYDKFVKLLTPIQNNFPGAASALKIIEDAFEVLSDPEKRSVFDMNRKKQLQFYGSRKLQEPYDVDSQHGYSSTVKKEAASARFAQEDSDRDDHKDSATNILPNTELEADDAEPSAQAMAHHVGDEHRNVVATAGSSHCPSLGSDRLNDESCCAISPITDKKRSQSYCKFDDMRKAESFAVGQVWAVYDEEKMPRKYAQIVNVKVSESPRGVYVNWVKPGPITMHQNRWVQAGFPFVCGLFTVGSNETAFLESSSFSHKVSNYTSGEIEIYPRKGEIWAICKDWEPEEAWCTNPRARKACKLQMVEIVREFSDEDDMLVRSLDKVDGFRSVYRRNMDKNSSSLLQISLRNILTFSHMVPAYEFDSEEMDDISSGMFELDPLATAWSSGNLACQSGTSILSSDAGEPTVRSKRSSEDFVPGEVWAVYDGPDSMPRRYVVINNVASESEVCVTFLEPRPENDWLKDNLPSGCGLFSPGNTTLNLGTSKFSHVAKFERCTDESLYRICPKKGEIWAMYNNWRNSDCKIVEIVTDILDESGLIVASLEQVPGCSTFFQRQVCDGFELVRAVPKREMQSFSHQIAAFRVPGVEVLDLSGDCWHLEPDALPPNLVL